MLPPDAPLGTDFVELAGLRDVVFDVNVTPDKGFALSVRGVARELAISYGVPFTDPADAGLPADVNEVSDAVYPASIDDPTACDRFVLREVRGIDPAARRRCGCWSGWPGPGSAASRWPSTSPTT